MQLLDQDGNDSLSMGRYGVDAWMMAEGDDGSAVDLRAHPSRDARFPISACFSCHHSRSTSISVSDPATEYLGSRLS